MSLLGHERRSRTARDKSGLPLTADIRGIFELVRFGAISSLMHRSQANPVRSLRPRGRARCRQIEAERLGGFQIDHQLVLGRHLHRQISRLRSGPYQRNHGPSRSGPNVSVLFVRALDEVAGRSSPGPRPQSNRTPSARAAELYISGSEMRVSIFTRGPARLKIGSQKA